MSVTDVNSKRAAVDEPKGKVKVSLNPVIDNEILVSSEKTPIFTKWLDQ